MKEPIRILQTNFTQNLGGIETIIMNIYRNIDRKKIQFDFLDDCNGIYFQEEIEKMGGNIIRIPTRRQNYLEYHRILKELINSGVYTAVHCNCLSDANIDIAKIAYKSGKTKVIIHSHQDMKLRHFKSEILHRYNRLWLSNKNIVRLACSEKAAMWIHGKRITKLGKVQIVHNAIEIDKFKYDEEISADYKSKLQLNGKFVIGCIGRFAYQKNYEFLAEVFSEIKKIKSNAVLVCVGGAGGMLETVIEKFKTLDIWDSVELLGIREDVEKIMQTFDVFVLPSRWEGLGIVYIEAQAAGVLTIASDVVPKETQVTECIHYISLKESPRFWAEQIVKLSSGYKKRNTIEKIKDKGYDIFSVAQQMQQLYLSLVE